MRPMTREPGTPLARPSASLVEAARADIRNITVEEAVGLLDDPTYQFVDIRDPRELVREGMVPEASKAPRGMLEFWVDPESPYYKASLDDGRTLVLYCGSGWRSALTAKTLQDMGFDTVAHLDGGFTAWKASGQEIAQVER